MRRRAIIPKEICPMALATEIIGDRWTLLILRECFYGVHRYEDMRADLDIPRAMLSNRLAKMTQNGLLSREPYREQGSRIRHAYTLTEKGQDLVLPMLALSQWGEKHILKSDAPISLTDKSNHKPLKVALVPQNTQVVALTDTKLAINKKQD